MTQEEDLKLVEGLRRRDGEAASAFFEKWKGPLFSYLMSLVRNRAAAEDLLQDVLVKVIMNIGRYRHRGRLKQWVFQIAYNVAMDLLRKTRRERSVSLDVGKGWTESLPDGGERPDEALLRDETTKELARAVDELPPEQRTVLHLRTRENLSFREIAGVMGTSVNTALGRMHYAVSTLRKRLKEVSGKAPK